MNILAQIVHDLVTKDQALTSAALMGCDSQVQIALIRLRLVLNLPPGTLADALARSSQPECWCERVNAQLTIPLASVD